MMNFNQLVRWRPDRHAHGRPVSRFEAGRYRIGHTCSVILFGLEFHSGWGECKREDC